MIRKPFNPQKLSLSDQQTPDMSVLPQQLLQMYNHEYSLLLSQTRSFFTECRDFFSRFVMLSNMGIGFNLPALMNCIVRVEEQVIGSNSKKEFLLHDDRQKHEQKFTQIVHRMGQVIQEMLSLQFRLKQQYLGHAFSIKPKVQANSKTKQICTTKRRTHNAHRLQLAGKSSSHLAEQPQNNGKQQALRSVLHKSMAPDGITPHSVCSPRLPLHENLEKLDAKLGRMRKQIEGARQKEERMWHIFEEKRPSRSSFTPLPEGDAREQDQQYKELSNILSDMISQKSRSYSMSPYETKESSIYR